MLSIYTSAELIPQIEAIIAQVYRLDELVTIVDLLKKKPESSAYTLIVRPKNGIQQVIDWQDTLPPYLLPESIELRPETLLGLIFARLGNMPKAAEYLEQENTLLHELEMIQRLLNGMPCDPSELHSDFHPFEEYRFCHNSAVLLHYGHTERNFDPNKIRYFYEEALKCAPDGDYSAFSTKHFAAFLTDMEDYATAARVLEQALPFTQSEVAHISLKSVLYQSLMRHLVVPYDIALMERIKTLIWEVLEYYRKSEQPLEEAIALSDAAQLAHYSDSFAEALGYINRAITLFQEAEIPELLAEAHHRRAMLLYTWVKNGSPQFVKGALDSFKEALKVFTRENAPETFANIQQYLGILYAEMPDETLKRSMWAAVSSAAFQDALKIYTKENYPYEYAMVCNHYGNALTKYPAAVHSDNIEKARFYYTEALSIRSPQAWPFERATTLLNYVEACWQLGLEADQSGQTLYHEMLAKTEEALQLTADPNIQEEARQQLQKLEVLRLALEQESLPSASA
ncbi:MAG: hypothetical protein J0L99_07235 [Chitinophagales bacterium]|nr:hypothetical protein [Chitinophagales bacterium]